jgi:hypothetical protein
MLPKNPLIACMRLGAYGGALELAKREGRIEAAANHSRNGRLAAQKLMSLPRNPIDAYSLWLFHRADGATDLATAAIRSVGQHPGSYCWSLAADCLRRNEPADALAEFQRFMAPQHRNREFPRLALAHLVRDDDGPEKVRELVGDLTQDKSFLLRRYAIYALCLVDTVQDVEAAARRAIARTTNQQALDKDPFLGAPSLKFLAGDIDAHQLLELAKDGGNFSNGIAHFTIGMKRLAERRRNDAYHHFVKCVETHQSGAFDYEWALAYVARMDADESWPAWLHEDANAHVLQETPQSR